MGRGTRDEGPAKRSLPGFQCSLSDPWMGIWCMWRPTHYVVNGPGYTRRRTSKKISAWIPVFTVWSVDGNLFIVWDNGNLIAVHWEDNSEKHREACIFPTGHSSIIQCGGRLQKMPAFSLITGCLNILIIRLARCCGMEMSPPSTLYLYRVTHRGPLQVSNVPRRPRTRRHKTKRLFSRAITVNNFKLGFCKFHQVYTFCL